MTETLGVALIGCGGVAAGYRSLWARLPGVQLRLVVDRDLELAQRVAAELGAARWSGDWRDALDEGIDLVDLSTPNHLHEEPAVALLGAGKHTLIQKPLAPSMAACARIVAAAQRADRRAGVYISDLDDPAMWDLRDAIRAGLLGTITGVRGRYAHRGGLSAPRSADYWRGSAARTGGGAFIQLAIHHLRLAAWLLDDTIESVAGEADNRLCPAIEGDDTSAAVARFAATRALGTFEASWSADGSCFQVYGSAGSATLHGTEGGVLEVRLAGPFSGRTLTADERGQGRRERIDPAAFRRPENPCSQHASFVEAVRQGRAPEVSVADGAWDVALCRAVYVSARTGRRVEVAGFQEETG